MISWGILVCCIAAVQDYAGLITARVCKSPNSLETTLPVGVCVDLRLFILVLGAAEAGFYPCVLYYLAFWYRPEELIFRIALFYSFGQVSGFFGGFLAFALSFADGVLAGWQWLFIIGQ